MARSLHRQRIRVVAATIANWETALPSRAIAAYVQISNRLPPEDFLEALITVLRAEKIDTILPMTDRALCSLAPHLNRLSEDYYIECPTAEQLTVILDKSATACLADSLGIPFPRTLQAHNLLAPSAEFRFPVFAKLRDKALQDTLTDPCDPVVGLVETQAELAMMSARYGSETLILQEYIKGDDVGLAVLIESGECLQSFQYRALRLYPASGGVCILAETERVNADLLAAALKMLTHLRWNGLAQIDFRHNRDTGQFSLLEINGRFWGSTVAAVKAGADFPLYTYQHLHQTSPRTSQPYKIGMRVHWLEGDLRRLLQYYKFCRASGTKLKIFRELFKVIAACAPQVRGMFWSWRDPAPSIHSIGSMFWYWAVSKIARFRTKRKPSLGETPGPTAVLSGQLDHTPPAKR